MGMVSRYSEIRNPLVVRYLVIVCVPSLAILNAEWIRQDFRSWCRDDAPPRPCAMQDWRGSRELLPKIARVRVNESKLLVNLGKKYS